MNLKHIRKKWFVATGLGLAVGLIIGIGLSDLSHENIRFARQVTAETETAIAPGIVEKKVVTRDENSDNQLVSFVTTYDTANYSNIGVTAGYKDMNFSAVGTSTVRQITNIAIGQGYNIVSAVNAGPYNMATGRQSGPLVHEGVIYQDYNVSENDLGSSFFGITKNHEYVIGHTKAEFVAVRNDLLECVTGMTRLLIDGQPLMDGTESEANDWFTIREPRTAIGFTRDGKLISIVSDGRNYPVSVGATYEEMAQLMIDAGAYQAMAFDGGGSTTLLNKVEGDSNLSLRNTPSDGAERKISTALMVYVEASYDGNFTHASISPKDSYYTPGSSVSFSAKGVDGAGGPAAIPSGAYWAVGDETYGSIDAATGLFTSSDKTGEVKIYLRDSRGTNLGSSKINIQHPDSLAFTTSTKSVGFDSDVELGLKGYYRGIEVELRAEDINFELSDPGLGTMKGLLFHSNPSETITGTIAAKSRVDNSVSDTMTIIVGAKPTVIDDFENYSSNDQLAANWNAYGGGNGYGNGGKNTIALGNYADGDMVRFGSHSLKIGYDFTNVKNMTEGASAGYNLSKVIDGAPTAVGMWVYATEADQGFWLRTRVDDAGGTTQQIDLTCQPSTCAPGVKPGINWVGWKYVEGSINPNWPLPLSITPGELVRFMYVPGNDMGSASAGSIYVDNVQFVYGSNTDDVETPVIDDIKINNRSLEEGETVDTNTINIALSFHDIDGVYATGIDYEKLKIYVDGIDYTEKSNFSVNENDNLAYIYDLILSDGYHVVRATVPDGFGNETSKSLGFYTAGTTAIQTAYIEAETDDMAVIGSNFNVNLFATNGEQLSTAELVVQLGQLFQDVDVEVGAGVAFTKRYSQGLRQMTIEFTFDPGKVWSGNREQFATIKLILPLSSSINSTTIFTLSSLKGVYSLKSSYTPAENQALSFAIPTINQPIVAGLTIENLPTLLGGTAVFEVRSDGVLLGDASIFVDGQLIGKTNSSGLLSIDNFSSEIKTFSFYAEKDGLYSYVETSQVLSAVGASDGSPTNISLNLVKDSDTGADITWFSNPNIADQTAKIQYLPTADLASGSEANWITSTGSSNLQGFYGDTDINLNGASLINHVRLTGLKPNTRYSYRVGDGRIYSPLRSFKTTLARAAVNFFVIGDTQTDDATKFSAIFDRLKADGTDYSFAVQTGDFIDNVKKYPLWEETLSSVSSSAMNDVPWLHAIGNHEIYGDTDAQISSDILSVPSKDYYSLEVGNVYLATIGYSSDPAALEEALKWLVIDAQSSSATFKVLVMHQPAYYTNPSGGNEVINRLVPSAVDSAGIDIVFSGHDHTYARTAEMSGGAITEGGATYFICGSTGEKSYSAINNPDFNFRVINQDFGSIYITVNTSLEAITINTYDGVTGQRIDSYTRRAYNNQETHNFVYQDGFLSCSNCGAVVDPVVAKYSGIILSYDGRKVYLLNGIPQTGYVLVGEDRYYFDPEGYGYTGVKVINGIKLNFENGLQVGGESGLIRDANGLRYLIDGTPQYGLTRVGNEYYYFGNDSYAVIGEVMVNNTKYYFTDDIDHYGQLIADFFYKTSNQKIKYYYTYGSVKTGVQNLRGAKVYLDNSGYLLAISNANYDLLLELYKLYYVNYSKSAAAFKTEYLAGLLDDGKLPTYRADIDGQSFDVNFLSQIEPAADYQDYDILFQINRISELASPKDFRIVNSISLRSSATEESLSAKKPNLLEAIGELKTNLNLASRKDIAELEKKINEFIYLKGSADSDLSDGLAQIIEAYNKIKDGALDGADKVIITSSATIVASLLTITVSLSLGLVMIKKWRKL